MKLDILEDIEFHAIEQKNIHGDNIIDIEADPWGFVMRKLQQPAVKIFILTTPK